MVQTASGQRIVPSPPASERHPVRRGLLIFALGLVALPVGVGLGPPHGEDRPAAGRRDGADLSGAVTFLAAQRDVDPTRIAAVGLSMGGEEAIGAAASDRRLRAVVAEGATNRVAQDKDWLSDVYEWRGAITEPVDRMVYGVADLLTAADQPIALRDAVVAAAPVPALLIAGGAMSDEIHAAEHIRAGSADSVQVWVAPEAGHVAALGAQPAEWRARVNAFLTAAIEGVTAPAPASARTAVRGTR